jgi:endosialidase-like protein
MKTSLEKRNFRENMKQPIQIKHAHPTLVGLGILVAVAFNYFAFPPGAQAVTPAPDGGYPGLNTAEGQNALLSLTTGSANTAVGWFSLKSDTTGGFNTALGAGSLAANTGDQNTATGAGALLSNTTGGFNTANGALALFSNTSGSNNTANGLYALLDNTTGNDNTAIGVDALGRNTAGGNNTAIGTLALLSNTTGGNNTAVGVSALAGNIDGNDNTAIGGRALANNMTGAGNLAIGSGALDSNTSGSFNVAINGGRNLTTGIFNIAIANDGVAGESNTTRIGILQNRCFISGIREVTTGVPDAINVMIDSAGQLGTVSSSRRFKKEIKPMDRASEAILYLKPVTFHYKSDHTARPQFGLIAEEVAEVNPDLVVRDKNGEIYTVRYDQVNAMLLNEFLKEHRKVQDLEKGMATITAQLKEQAAQIQNVSAYLEISKPATNVVLNNP